MDQKKVDTHPGNSTQPKKRSFLQRLGGCLLCVCLVVVSTPVEYCIWPAMSAQAEDEETLEYTMVEQPEQGAPMADGSLAETPEDGLTDQEDGLADQEDGNSANNEDGSEAENGDAEQPEAEAGDDQENQTENPGEAPEEGEDSGSDAGTDEDGDPADKPSDTEGENQPKDPAEEGEETEDSDQEEPGDGEETEDPDPSEEGSADQPDTPKEPAEDGNDAPEEGDQPEEGEQPKDPEQDVPADNAGAEGEGMADNQAPGAADDSDAPVEEDSMNEMEELLFQISNALNVAQVTTGNSNSSNFYFGEAGNFENVTNDPSKPTTFPKLEPIKDKEGNDKWEAVGWVTDSHDVNEDSAYKPGSEIKQNGNYYALYKRTITVTYIVNGQTVTRTGTAYLNIHGSTSLGNKYTEVTYDTVWPNDTDLNKNDHTLIGWSTSENGEIIDFKGENPNIHTEGDITLYPVYGKNVKLDFWSGYDENSSTDKVNHVEQDTWVRGEINAPSLTEKDGWVAVGWCTSPDGKGDIIKVGDKISVTGAATYYGVYKEKQITLIFDPNEGEGELGGETLDRLVIVGSGSGVTYIKPQFDLSKKPYRPGYSFNGWYIIDGNGNKVSYHEDKATFDEDTTLIADWKDDIAPVFGEPEFGEGYNSVFDWFIGKTGLTITVPVTEEGSGMLNAQYVLYPNTDLEEGFDIDLSQGQVRTVRVLRQGGKTYVQFTLDKGYKGSIALVGKDNAGNTSLKKILTVKGGVIVEDHAPEINFSADSTTIFNDNATVNVNVEDALKDMISGGLKTISYQIDNGRWIELPADTFNSSILERHHFQVTIAGEGIHTLRIKAVDNAGNVSEKQIRVNIQKEPEDNPGTGDEDNQGDGNNPGDGTNPGDGNTGTGDGTNPGGDNPGNSGNPGGNPGNPGGNPGGSNPGNPGNGNTGYPNISNILDSLFNAGNTGSIGGGTGNPGGSWGGNTGNSGTGSTGRPGLGSIGNNIVKDTGSGADVRPLPGEPQTGEFSHVEIYATLGMIAGFTYLLLYFQNGERGMTEEKKDVLISRLSRWAARGGVVRKGIACMALFLLLAYYHSIGQCREWADSLREMTRA